MLDRTGRTEKAFMKAFMVQWGKPSTSNGLEMIRAIMSAQKKVPYMWGFNILAPESDQLNSLVNNFFPITAIPAENPLSNHGKSPEIHPAETKSFHPSPAMPGQQLPGRHDGASGEGVGDLAGLRGLQSLGHSAGHGAS